MESLIDTFDFPRSSANSVAPPASDRSKTSPSNSTLFRFRGTHWQCAHCVESVLYSLAKGHVEHVRMWKCCQCGFAENRVSLLAACSMCDYTNYRKDYACQYPSDKVLEAAEEGAETDSAAYKPSDVIRVEAPGISPGIHASDDFISTVQRNLPSLGPFFTGRGHERLEDVLVLSGSYDPSMLISIDNVEDTGFGSDRTRLVHVSHANLPISSGIDEPVSTYSRGDINFTAANSNGNSSTTTSALTKTNVTPSTLTAVTRPDLDSGYGSQSNISNVEKAPRKRASETDHPVPPKSDTIDKNTSSPPRKRPRRRRCDTTNPGLACPFYVRNPHCCEHDSCARPGFLGIHRLKQHLERVHLYHTCERCGAAFQGNATGRLDLAMHQRNTQPCLLVEKPSAEISSLSHATFEVMRSKKGAAGKSEEERWREIYRLIFPDADDKELRKACELYLLCISS